ncbi:unnamed protein product, partial [marine sediment metagenome]
LAAPGDFKADAPDCASETGGCEGWHGGKVLDAPG